MAKQLLEGESEEQVVRQKATLDQLKKKQRVSKTITVVVNGDDGEPIEAELEFRGIPAHEYDEMIAKYPPRKKDRDQGYGYNPEKFGPAIIAATCVDPDMTVEDAEEIWKSDDWNRGERMMLLMAAIEVCTAGLNVPFKRRVSE